MARHNTTGRLGEEIALEYLERRGFTFVERNYNKKWGEVDLIMRRRGVIHFVEVKSTESAPPRRTRGPSEKVDQHKIERLSRAIQTYAIERGITLDNPNWQCDVCVVYLDRAGKTANVNYIPNILIPGR